MATTLAKVRGMELPQAQAIVSALSTTGTGGRTPRVSPQQAGEDDNPYGTGGGDGGNDNNVVFKKAGDGRIWQSGDGGRTWEPAPDQFQPPPETTFPGYETPGIGPWSEGYGPGTEPVVTGINPDSANAADALGLSPATFQTIQALKEAGLLTADEASDLLFGKDGSGGSGDGVGWGNLAQRKVEFASAEDQRRIDNENWLRQFGLSQTTANRNELGQRAGVGLSTGNLALDLALRQDKLANDAGNFPAWLQAMQGNTAQGPVAQSLVNAGTTITPAPNDYLNDPRFKTLLDSLLNYGTVPDAGAVDQTQQAYNTDPNAANTFFSQDPEALKRMFGTPMAMGGSFTTSGPMTFKDLSSGKNIATAGEAGPETVTVTPQQQQAQPNPTGQGWMDAWRAYHPGEPDPVSGYGTSPSSGTAQALGKVLGAGGFSFVPPDIRNTLLGGNLPAPGQFPDWMLAKLPPSIRQLLSALITSKLGSSGAEDYNFTRGLYEAPGFSGAGGVVR